MAFSLLMFAYDPFLLSPKDSTQVESRLPTLQPRRSLLPGPKTSHARAPHISPTTPSTPFRHLLVGQRVETTDGRTGLLHFKGKTHFAQGCMCGIELDDPIGKHDGSVDGIHYFDCPQNYGVFVPAHKVHNLPPPSPSSPTSTLSQNSSTSICSREGKDCKPSSKIPSLGLAGGKLPRPKTLPVSKDSAANSKLKPSRRSGKSCDAGKSDCSSDKSSTSGKLFQSKKISPVHTNITHSGWTGDNRTKADSKRTTESHSRHKAVHNTTYCVSDNKRQYARVSATQEKSGRSGEAEKSSKSLLQQKLARNKNVNGKLHSRPSLNDLTRTFGEGEGENRKDKPDIVEGCYSKLNETFELDKEVSSFFQDSCSGSLGWDDSHSLSPLEDSSSGREKSDSSLAWDFEVPQSSTPVQIHLQVSSDVRTSIPEEPRIYPLGIGATAPAFPVDSLSSCDTENTDEEVEYNEFLAIPSFLDTPTGRYKFDLLTPEELEQALNEYNLLPEELQDAIEFEPQFSDVKPKIWEPITTVEDEFFHESSNALFAVPLTAMDPELQEKYEGIETPTMNSGSTTPIAISSNGMEVDCYPEEVYTKDVHGKQREYPSVLPTPTAHDQRSISVESGTSAGDCVHSQGTLSDAHDITLVDNPSSMDDGVDLSEDFEMEVDPHNTTYDVDIADQDVEESQSSTFLIEKCPERRQEGDGQEGKVEMLYESNNNTPVPMSPVDLLEGTIHLKTCEAETSNPEPHVIVSSGADVEVSQTNGVTTGRIVTTVAAHTLEQCYSGESPQVKLERVMMETEEDLKFRMDEMAVEVAMADSMDESKSVASECSRTESDRANDSRDWNPKMQSGHHSGELQAVMEVGMCLTSNNGHPVKSGVRSGTKDHDHPSKEDEKKDEEKSTNPGKRKSLLLTPKKVSKTLSSHSTHLQVTLSRPKTATSSSAGHSSKPPPGQSNGDKDNKKTYTPSSWRSEKSGNGTTKSSVIPRRKSENRSATRLERNGPGRYSADAAHLVQKLQPILDVKNSRKAESTSSMEVDPGSMSSSKASMRSEVTASSNTSKTSSKNAQSGKHKTTLSARASVENKRHERKPSSSSVTSDHSHRTESKASISSRPSSSSSREVRNVRRKRTPVNSTQSSRNVTASKPPVPTNTSRSRQATASSSGRTTHTKSGTKTSHDSNATNIDAAPTRKSGIPAVRKSSIRKKEDAQKEKDPHHTDKHGHKSKTPNGHSLQQTPPDLVYTSLVNGDASQEIKRLESLCETRFNELGTAKEQLQQATQGFDAMSLMVRYLTQDVDAFSTPWLKSRNGQLEKQLSTASETTAHQEAEISRLREKLEEESRCHGDEMQRMEMIHLDEISNVKETLQTNHRKEIQTMITDHEQEIRRLTNDHQQEMCDMTASHQSLVRDIEGQHADHVSHLGHAHVEQMEDLMRERDEEVTAIRGDAEEKITQLQDEVFKWKYQVDCQTKRIQELEDALRRDDNAKVQAAISQYKHLPDEVASMKVVMEIKNQELHDLRITKMALEKQVETLDDKDEKIKLLQAKVEDVKALMAKKTEYERQLSSEHVHLRESYERESHVNKRLSMENEELMWKLNQGDGLSPPPRFKATAAPSPSPSPTGTRKGFLRSSSTESHESGVYSPNPMP